MNVLRALRWPVYEGYEVDGGEIEIFGDVSRYIDLGDESQQLAMLKDWLSIGDLDDVATFLSLYGYPMQATFKNPLRSFQIRPRSEAPMSAKRLLEHAQDWRYNWDLMTQARTNPEHLSKFASLLMCNLIPGKPFERYSYFDGDHEDGKTVYELRQVDSSENELAALGRANFEKIQNGIDPFPMQYKQLVEAYDDAETRYGRKFRVNGNERAQLYDVSPNRVVLYLLCRETFERNSWNQPRLRDRIVEDWLYDWKHELASATLEHVSSWLNRSLKNISPQVTVVSEDGEQRIRPFWNVSTPRDAMALAFYKETTQSSLLEFCPHPSCGKIFLKTRTDRVSCGSSKCKQYVTKQNRMTRYKEKRLR